MKTVGAQPIRATAGPRSPAPAWLLVAAVMLAALNLRTAVTSVGPLLDELERGIGLSSALAGLLTTMPVLAFAGLGWVTPAIAARFGAQRVLTGALVMMTAGLVLRALAGSAWLFLAMSVPALAGGAMGNVLLPVMVKRHFPGRVGPMTAAYTTSLAVGTTLAAGLTVPIASVRGGLDWRLGLGSWAVLSAVAALLWLLMPHRSERAHASGGFTHGRELFTSPTAWALALFFGAQSMQAYISLGWFALFFRERAAFSPARAGLLVAVMASMSIPVSMVVPYLAARLRSQRPIVAACLACYVVAYSGMLTAPRAGAWLWAVLAGLGAGAFPLALTLIGLRSRTPQTTTALSAFAQSIGYVVAGTGPLLVGVLHGHTGGWTGPFVVLFADLGLFAISGWYVSRPRYVDDDLATV